MWKVELTELLRIFINDFEGTLYSDTNLQRVLVSAAFQVLREGLTFNYTFTADMGDQDITPDPTDPDSLDESFSNLICLKAACLINRGDAAKAARQAIAIRDGSSAVDLRDILKGALSLLNKGYCAAYEKEVLNFKMGAVAVAGAAILGPFRIYARESFGYNAYNGGWADPANLYGSL